MDRVFFVWQNVGVFFDEDDYEEIVVCSDSCCGGCYGVGGVGFGSSV